MDRHSSYIFIWLQLELCAMAVLLTRGEGGRAPGDAAGSPAGPRDARGAAPRCPRGGRPDLRRRRREPDPGQRGGGRPEPPQPGVGAGRAAAPRYFVILEGRL